MDPSKREIGETVQPGGREEAPGRLALLQRFINTHNHDFPADWDRLGTAPKATAWLREKALIAPSQTVSAEDAGRLREFREQLRALVVGHRVDALPAAPLRVALDAEGSTRLEPVDPGADGAVAALLAILHEAQLSGDWGRMKGCRQCEYAFYDRSKNRSATWCSMSVCGNRTKNRTYYRRRRQG